MSQMRLYLLGSPRVEIDGQPIPVPRRKVSLLLSYLAVAAQTHQRDAQATLFWPDTSQRAGPFTLND